ncbi:protein-L-isoaspartate(D-aspartate) O-methyltransferase [Methylobacterium segetis]|uniref:protein-L-isoaspartate(D-aspartate) O-methyltransferase n=1 Tax=Methylobacterium segetis TaxID=2488750 RepID=UPI001FE21948|nr:protein-L-isoaspartate(D-aspartate) O-methyltransferase [Methylobacterium segetis]
MADFAGQRARMIERQIRWRGVTDDRVLAAMSAVPREVFVPEDLRGSAYDDAPLPIGGGQTISQPYIVALMVEAAAICPEDRVLEIGAGSGYAAAVIGCLAREVDAVERHPVLAEAAARRLDGLGYRNVRVHRGDGTLGLPARAPFDVILSSASAPDVPEAFRQQLREGGRLVMPVGGRLREQVLVRVLRRRDGAFETRSLGPVSFVPLIGAAGWPEDPPAGASDRRGECAAV